MAAGITVPKGGLPAFQAFLEARLAAPVEAALHEDVLAVDGALSAGALKPELYADLAKAGPFGAGNPEPIFVLPNHILLSADEVGTGHLRLRVRAADGSTAGAIAFRVADQQLGVALRRLRGQPVHLAGCLQLDEWGGRANVGFRLIDAAEVSEEA